jgi:hypothetical protein
MAPPGFEGEHGDPFGTGRCSAALNQFADPGATTVIVAPEIVSRLRSAAVREHPRETGGLLCGRVLRDSGGRYVIVSDFVQAAPGTGRAGTFVMSAGSAVLMGDGGPERRLRQRPLACLAGLIRVSSECDGGRLFESVGAAGIEPATTRL